MRIASLLVLLVLLGACGTRKKLTINQSTSNLNTPKLYSEAMAQHDLTFDFLTYKSSGKVSVNGSTFDLTLTVRMQQNEKLWISLQAILGIEVARLLLTKDSLYLVQNQPSRRYEAWDIETASAIFGVPLEVGLAQRILLGQGFGTYIPFQVAVLNDSTRAEYKIAHFLVQEALFPQVIRPAKREINNSGTGQFAIFYQNPLSVNDKYVPGNVYFNIHTSTIKADCNLRYYDFKIGQIPQFPFPAKPKP